jgi:hypothetical protein
MTSELLTAEDKQWFDRQARIDARFHEVFDTDELIEKFGGQWIATDGTAILAHAKDADEFERQLNEKKLDRNEILIRFIYPGDVEFSF